MSNFQKHVNGMLLLLLLAVVPSIAEDTIYDGGVGLLRAYKNSPIVYGRPCTLRSSNTSVAVDTNIDYNNTEELKDSLDSLGFEDQTTPPPCPKNYFCDVPNAGDVSGFCLGCWGNGPGNCDDRVEQNGNHRSYLPSTLAECKSQCETELNTCSSNEDCHLGTFCDFRDENSGFCAGCPGHLSICQYLRDTGGLITEAALASCQSSCAVQCHHDGSVTISVVDNDEGNNTFQNLNDVNAVTLSFQRSVTGPMVECTSENCNAEGAVCVIEYQWIEGAFLQATCVRNGGIAIVLHRDERWCNNSQLYFIGFEDINIPAVTISYIDGRNLVEKAQSYAAESETMLLTAEVGGNGTNPTQCDLQCTPFYNTCSAVDLICNRQTWLCGEESGPTTCDLYSIDCNLGEFCDFVSKYEGFCQPCPDEGVLCLLSGLSGEGALQCIDRCNGGSPIELNDSCKFCAGGKFNLYDKVKRDYDVAFMNPWTGSMMDDSIENEPPTEEKSNLESCQFCATAKKTTCDDSKWDMKYPDRTIEMFDHPTECGKVAEFYDKLDIAADSFYCRAARSRNYICGCSDSAGYAGAKSKERQIFLAWVPRIGAIMSIMGSTSMIVTTMQDVHKRTTIIGELVILLSTFDVVGSLGYALTSLPIPRDNYIYGGKGNKKTCIAQGFIIQLGTISVYLNVAIAFYYYWMVKRSWDDRRLRKSWTYYLMFFVPIVVGAAIAFAGIPHYKNAYLWCNISQLYWSEIPIAVAIGIATIQMLQLCYYINKANTASRNFLRYDENRRASLSKVVYFESLKERAATRIQGHNQTSTGVFWQSMMYLGAFYLTWLPYLVLQIMGANDQYYFFLVAGTLATLQGFWNWFFHMGYNKICERFSFQGNDRGNKSRREQQLTVTVQDSAKILIDDIRSICSDMMPNLDEDVMAYIVDIIQDLEFDYAVDMISGLLSNADYCSSNKEASVLAKELMSKFGTSNNIAINGQDTPSEKTESARPHNKSDNLSMTELKVIHEEVSTTHRQEGEKSGNSGEHARNMISSSNNKKKKTAPHFAEMEIWGFVEEEIVFVSEMQDRANSFSKNNV